MRRDVPPQIYRLCLIIITRKCDTVKEVVCGKQLRKIKLKIFSFSSHSLSLYLLFVPPHSRTLSNDQTPYHHTYSSPTALVVADTDSPIKVTKKKDKLTEQRILIALFLFGFLNPSCLPIPLQNFPSFALEGSCCDQPISFFFYLIILIPWNFCRFNC